MIVAYRGNFRHPFCTEVHVAASLEALGHQVVRLQEDQTPWPACVEAAKRAHLFLWTKTWQIDVEGGHAALDAMKQAGVPTASFHLDRYMGLDREAQIADGDPFWRTQFVFTADGGNADKFAAYSVNHFWMPPGMYDAEANIGRPSPRYRQPIVFVGSHPYPHAEWREYRDELISRVQVRFGADFAIWPKGRPIRNKELSDLYASCKVVIGDSCLSGGATHYWSDRVPETLGRGALLIHPWVEGLDDWYVSANENEWAGDLLTYELGNFDALLFLVQWALDNPENAAAIATQGQFTVLGRDTYKHRLVEVIDIIGARATWPDIPVPNETTRATRRDSRNRPVSVAFEVRPGHPTDREVIEEVWSADQYQLRPEHVKGGVVIDIGANIGAFSALAAALGAAEVLAFEPEPGNARMCRANTGSFGATVRAPTAVTVYPTAVGARTGTMWLSPGPGGVHGGGSHGGPVEDAPDDGGVVVDVVAIDDVIGAQREVAVLKIDCEGGEYDIIAGLSGEQLPKIARIVMEFHGPGMPHLADDLGGEHEQALRFGAMIAKLAAYGHVEIHGRPQMGGLLFWQRY